MATEKKYDAYTMYQVKQLVSMYEVIKIKALLDGNQQGCNADNDRKNRQTAQLDLPYGDGLMGRLECLN